MNWTDERELALVSLIASILFMTILDLQLGVIYTGMIISYYLFIKRYSIQFSKDRRYFTPSILIIAIIGVVGYYLVASLLNIPLVPKSIIGFTISDISISNPILKTLIWLFFIPLAETLFIFGLVFGYMRRKMNIGKNEGKTLIAFILLGILVAVFHLKSQNMNQQTLMIDIAFTVISGIAVLHYNELKQAFWIHVFANAIGLFITGGLLWLFH